MLSVIDSPYNLSEKISTLRTKGVKAVIRYFNHSNSQTFPNKRLEVPEATTINDAGISLGVVFQARGGAGGHIEDFGAANGTRDGARARALAERLGQPHGSGIYFAVDWDFYKLSDLSAIALYFDAVNTELRGQYRVGVYGSGKVATLLLDKGLASLVWLSGSMGWSGTKDMLATDRWSLFQKELDRSESGIAHDGNVVSPANPDWGQFDLRDPAAAAATFEMVRSVPLALMQVSARSGLVLRRGPGRDFSEIDTLPFDTVVRALERSGEWVKVDREGDGIADGYMFGGYLTTVSGGLPLPVPVGSRAIDIARQELASGVAEVPGPGNNPRILLYHSATSLKAKEDSVAWCSSFVNYCVRQVGMRGTNSAGARSWHDDSWGVDTTNAPMEGDIAVFSRTGGGASAGSGHVGFWMGSDGSNLRVLGGNQGDRVSIDNYPINGKKGSFTYKLLSVRRG